MNDIDYYDVKRVSASSLSWFEQSPLYFKMMLDKEIDEESKHYFIQGDKIHKFILEPDEYKYTVLDYETPTGKQKEFIDAISNFPKDKHTDQKILEEYKKVYVAKGKDEDILEKAKLLMTKYRNYIQYKRIQHVYDFIWSTKENEYMENLRSQVYNHKVARELLAEEAVIPGNVVQGNEFEIYWEHPSGVECKSKLDRMIIDLDNKVIKLIDLKTTSDLANFDKHSFIKFKYYRQMAFYLQAIDWYVQHVLHTDTSDFTKEVYIVAIGKKEPVEVRVYKVDDKLIQKGNEEIDELLNKIAWHQETDQWQYPEDYYNGNGIILIEDESTDT